MSLHSRLSHRRRRGRWGSRGRRSDSSRLPPSRPQPNQGTHQTCQSRDTIIKLHPSKRIHRQQDITTIRQQLGLNRLPLLIDRFLRQSSFRFSLNHPRFLGTECGQSVETGEDRGGQAEEPELLGGGGEGFRAGGRGEGADFSGVQEDEIVESKVTEVAELPEGGEVGF